MLLIFLYKNELRETPSTLRMPTPPPPTNYKSASVLALLTLLTPSLTAPPPPTAPQPPPWLHLKHLRKMGFLLVEKANHGPYDLRHCCFINIKKAVKPYEKIRRNNLKLIGPTSILKLF